MKRKFLIIASVVVLGFILVLALHALFKPEDSEMEQEETGLVSDTTQEVTEGSEAIQAGKSLSGGNCEGSGPVELTHLPMKEEDFVNILPYGMTVGAHVTPIDHQYFTPVDFYSPRDTYEVYAMADGIITEIQSRGEGDAIEYRIVFMHSCTFFTYFDLVTSLTPVLMTVFEEKGNGTYAPDIDYDVKGGTLIGYIGGQTLDFAVWDTEKPLTGFTFPEHYDSEPWKQYTADPYDYYAEDIKDILIEKNVRTVEPISGRIDYDIPGKLIGNWFLKDTNWYGGDSEPYYQGHLSIAPNHIDPTGTIISIGDFNGDPGQFLALPEAPDPANVSVETGMVKYDLMDFEYVDENGGLWDSLIHGKNITIQPAQQNNGCMVVELETDTSLKMEVFPGVVCNQVAGFGGTFRMYER